jgi:transcriptional regulator with XRE-family HTH domain
MANVRAYGRWLKQTRTGIVPKLTQRQLAELAGVSATYVSRLEGMGDDTTRDPIDNPTETNIDAISRALGKMLRRPVVNEARRVLGYAEVLEEEPVEAFLLPPVELGMEEWQKVLRLSEWWRGLGPQDKQLTTQVLRELAVSNPNRPVVIGCAR